MNVWFANRQATTSRETASVVMLAPGEDFVPTPARVVTNRLTLLRK